MATAQNHPVLLGHNQRRWWGDERAAYSIPIIRQIVRLEMLPFRYSDGRQITLQTTNKLMKRCDYVTGMKTGYTKAAGKCLVSSGASGNRHVIAIILGSSSKYIWDESKSLIDYGLSQI